MDNMNNPSFDKISQRLGTTFEQDVSAAETQLQTISDRKNQIQEQVTQKNELALRDQEYLLTEIKLLIQSTLSVLERLDQDIKVGTEARKYEVFAALTNAVTGQLKELRELNKMIADMEIFKNHETGKSNTQVNVEMNGKDLLDWLDKVRSEREIDRIDPEFNIMDDNPPKGE
jgi:hypothetical protein